MSACGLILENLSFGYGAEPVLKDVSFTVERGNFCALLGPNGAGKTSLFSLLTRLATTSTGRIEIAGIDLGTSPRAALARIGIVFQQMTLDLDLTVRRNLSYYAALRGLSGRDADSRIDAALERLELGEKSSVRARDLNGGHRRRTEIARCLLHDPEILLLDEPTVGLDPASRAAITDHVHRLCVDEALTVLWATHLVDEVQAEDDLVILHRGGVLAHDTARRIAGEQTVEKVFLDMTAVTS
ncbi:ABC transporter ATP-binding protein [Tropicimonas aquimaris]|uniref:ABC transporter ATP-binding protein n=1 Tax=Tropicimonas aquimaris TaxID=914152 RepID=A0ABW3IS51_9RHOB